MTRVVEECAAIALAGRAHVHARVDHIDRARAHRRLAARVDGSDGEIKDLGAIVVSHAVTLRPLGR